MKKIPIVILCVVVCLGLVLVASIMLLRRSTSMPPTLMANKVITGVVTSKFTDCVGGKEIDDAGNIVPISQVSCDGGSTITIDRTRSFITASGLVRPENSFGVNVSDIEVGDRVTVHYNLDSEGYTTLRCSDCGITKQK